MSDVTPISFSRIIKIRAPTLACANSSTIRILMRVRYFLPRLLYRIPVPPYTTLDHKTLNVTSRWFEVTSSLDRKITIFTIDILRSSHIMTKWFLHSDWPRAAQLTTSE